MPKATHGGASNGWEVSEQPVAVAAAEPVVVSAESPVAEEDAAPAEEEPEQEALSAADVAAGYTDLSFAQLRAAAKERGLSAGGTAVELAARLAEHDAAPASPVAAPEPAEV